MFFFLLIFGKKAKNVEERNIPWSQQVDEASYENLSSPGDENTCMFLKYNIHI